MHWKNLKLHSSSGRSAFYFIVYGIQRASRQYKNFSSAMFITEVISDSFCASQREHSITIKKYDVTPELKYT